MPTEPLSPLPAGERPGPPERPETGGEPAPWTRLDRRLLFLLGLLCLATLPWTVHPWYDHANDAATYVLTTRNLLAGEGYTYLGTPMIVRPPGLSVMLLPVMALFGESFTALNLFVALFGVLATVLFFALLRPSLGGPVACAAALVVWFNPFFQRTSAQVLSDVPGLALLFGCLLLDRACRRRPSWGRHLLLGLGLAATMYVRTVFGVLIPALVLGRLVQRLRRSTAAARRPWRSELGYLACVLLVPLLAYLPWAVHVSRAEVPTPTEHLYIHSYWTAMWHEDAADPASPRLGLDQVLARAPEQLRLLAVQVGGRMGEGRGGPALKWTGLAALLLGLGLGLRRRAPEDFFLAGSIAVLALFYTFPERLALPVWVLLVPAVAQALLAGLRRLVPERTATGLVLAGLAALGLADFQPWPWQPKVRDRHEAKVELAAYLDTITEPGESFAAAIGWHYGVYTRQPFYSLQITVAQENDPTRAVELLERRRVRAVVFNMRSELGRTPPRELMERLRKKAEVGRFAVYVVRGRRSEDD